MKILVLAVSILFLFTACQEEQPDVPQHIGMKFEKFSTYDSILIKAKKENKAIFIDCYASWCGPCKMMAKNVFPDTMVGAYMNAHFVNYKIDMEKEGKSIKDSFGVKYYPTYVFLDAEGNQLHRAVGYFIPSDFIDKAAEAKDSDRNLWTKQQKYDSGERSAAFLKEFAAALDDAALDFSAPVKDYLDSLSETTYGTTETYEFFMQFLSDINSSQVKYIIENRATLQEAYGKEEYNVLMYQIADKHFRRNIKGMTKSQFEKVTNFMIENQIENAHRLAFEMEIYFHMRRKDWISLEKSAIAKVDEFFSEDAYELNKIAWAFYKHVENKNSLKKAVEWSKKASQLDPNYAHMDTYAAVAYKAGDFFTARNAALKAIEMGKSDGVDVKETENLLVKIKEQMPTS